MRTIETRDHWTLINDNGDIVAQVGPTFLKQPKHVLLYPLCTAGERVEALGVAARRCPRHEWETNLDDEALLKAHGIEVLDLDYETSAEAIAAAVALAGVPGLRATLGEIPWCDERKVRFRVGRANRFEFWNSVDVPKDPNGMWALHVVPAYHPKVTGAKEYSLINGNTDCNIRGNTVRYVMSPRASRPREIESLSCTWAHVRHPFVGVGRSVDRRVCGHVVRTTAGVECLAAYRRAALRLDGRYIGVSGGFNPPLRYPSNHCGIPYKSTRGSEHSCVWEYRTLQREGHLAGAFVPPWFHRENWLGKYENAVERHGAF